MSEQVRGLLTIVPRDANPRTGLVLTQGTKLLLDGKEVSGVTKVVITGEHNDIWRAEIHCMVNMKAMPGMLIDIERSYHSSWWRKALVWLAQINIGRA